MPNVSAPQMPPGQGGPNHQVMPGQRPPSGGPNAAPWAVPMNQVMSGIPAKPAQPVIPQPTPHPVMVSTPYVPSRPSYVPNSDVSGPGDGAAAGLAVIAIIVIAALVRVGFGRTKKNVITAQVATAVKLPNVVPLHPLIMPPPSAYSTDAGSNAPPSPIDTTRQLLGPAPRKFDSAHYDYLSVHRPPWLPTSAADPLADIFINQDRLRYRGRVVWGALVQANGLLFQPGPMDHAASVIWSEDPYFDHEPNALVNVAMELYQLKGTDQADPDASVIARLLSSETGRGLGIKVPKRFTEGRAVQHSAMMLTRKHLPDGFLTRNLFPVWLDPEPTGQVLLVPAAYWPASLLSWWKTPDPVPASETI